MSGITSMMLGASGGVALYNHTLEGVDIEIGVAASASASYQLLNSGAAQAVMTGNTSNPPVGTTQYPLEWYRSGPAANYEVRATLNSGTLSSGTTGTWLNLGTSRTWSCSAARAVAGTTTQQANLTIEIRDAASGAILASATVIVFASAEFIP